MSVHLTVNFPIHHSMVSHGVKDGVLSLLLAALLLLSVPAIADEYNDSGTETYGAHSESMLTSGDPVSMGTGEYALNKGLLSLDTAGKIMMKLKIARCQLRYCCSWYREPMKSG